MAKRQIPELVKFVIDNLNAPDMAGSLKDFKSDMDTFLRTVESSSEALAFFQSRLKSITTDVNNPDFGRGIQEIFVDKESSATVEDALNAKATQLGIKRGFDYEITTTKVPVRSGSINLVGEDAFKEAQIKVRAEGGDIWREPTAKSPDRAVYYYPWEGLNPATSPADKRAKTASIFGEASKLSKDADTQRQLNEDKKETKARERQASKETAEEKKKNVESAHRATAITKNILAIVTVATDILRRILTAALQNASKMDKQTAEAHAVNMSYMDRRALDIFDKAHGLPEGASFNAVKSVQSMFGDITRLDESALGTLARVMGSEVGDLVKSGIGGENPDKLLEKILDNYFAQFKAGKNSLGQNVGQEQARRELTSSLQSVSPEIATLFARMVDDFTSGVYGKFENTQEWRETTDTNRTGLTQADTTFAAEVGKKYNEIIAIVDDLKTSFFTRLAGSMNGLLDSIKNIRIGTTAEKSLQMDKTNYAKNIETKDVLKATVSAYNASAQQRIDEINRGIVGYDSQARFHYSAETLAKIASGEIDDKYLAENVIEGSGMLSNLPAERKAYLARGNILAESALMDTQVSDEVAKLIVIAKKLKELDVELEKDIGGNVKEVTATPAEITSEAQKQFKDVDMKVRKAYVEGSATQVQSQVIVDRLKESYIEYMRDTPVYFQEMLINMFGGTTLEGTPMLLEAEAVKNAKKSAYNYVEIDPSKEASRRNELRNVWRTRVEKAKAESGGAISADQENEILMEIIAEYNAGYWEALLRGANSSKSSQSKHIIGTIQSELTRNMNTADSTVLDYIVRELQTYGKGIYSYSGKQNQAGEYVLTIIGKDTSGKETARQQIVLTDIKSSDIAGTAFITDRGVEFKEAK